MHDIPLLTYPDTHISSYADDNTVFSQDPHPETVLTHLQKYIHTYKGNVAPNKQTKSLHTKSTLTLITPWSSEEIRQPPVTLNGELVSYTNHPTSFGLTYDGGMTFGQHIQNINTEPKTRLNVLRALTNTFFSRSKEDITQVYKQYIRLIHSYAHPSWELST